MYDVGAIAVNRVQPVCDREEGRSEGIERQRDCINKLAVNYISF